jgi:FAD/FMN-containing dehydrogenase
VGQIAHLPPGDWEVAGEAEADAGDRIWEEAQVLYDALPEPVVRVVVRPRQLGEFLMRRAPRAWLAHAGNGIVFMTADPGQIRDLRREFPVVLERASPEVRREVATFGRREPELGIMRRLKASLDPRFRLNPGRHVDGERSE